MFSRFTSKIVAQLLNAIELQLFLMITSLPILTCWGMPLSLLAIAGNIIFAPFLVIFLGMTSIACIVSIFNCNFCFLSILLNWFTDFWYYLLRLAPSSVLIYVPQPPFFLLIIPIVSLLILYKNPRSYKSQILRIIGLCMICISSILVWHMSIIPGKHVIDKQCTIDRNAQGLVIYYSGRAPKNYDSWIRYTFIPCCAKNYGTIYCDSFIITSLTTSQIGFMRTFLPEIKPQKVIIAGYKDERIKNSLMDVLQENNYKKMKGNVFALHPK